MRQARDLAAALVLILGASGPAQAVDLSDLRGKSIRSTYTEIINSPRGSFRQTWQNQIYISTQGRIFHRVNIVSDIPQNNVSRDLLAGEGRGRPYRWNGAFVRQFMNPRNGVRIFDRIDVSGSAPGSRCTQTIERLGARSVIQPVSQSCVVVAGNVLGGRD